MNQFGWKYFSAPFILNDCHVLLPILSIFIGFDAINKAFLSGTQFSTVLTK